MLLKSTLRTCRRVLRYWEVPPGLGRGPGEEHSLIRENWDCGRIEMRLEEGEQKKDEDDKKGFEDNPGES